MPNGKRLFNEGDDGREMIFLLGFGRFSMPILYLSWIISKAQEYKSRQSMIK